MQITKDMIIGDVLDANPELAVYLQEVGMGCMGCPGSRAKTLAEGCEKHGADVDAVVAKMNQHAAE